VDQAVRVRFTYPVRDLNSDVVNKLAVALRNLFGQVNFLGLYKMEQRVAIKRLSHLKGKASHIVCELFKAREHVRMGWHVDPLVDTVRYFDLLYKEVLAEVLVVDDEAGFRYDFLNLKLG
jgi:hypothetical protein